MSLPAASRPSILILTDYYLPGEKSGGLVRSLGNVVAWLGDDLDFFVITRDRDWSASKPYDLDNNVIWHTVGKARVFYDSQLSSQTLRAKIREVHPDVLHLTSFFSPLARKILLLRRAGLLPDLPLIISPIGQFTPGALGLKRLQKKLFMSFARATGLCRGVVWHASTALDAGYIRRFVGMSSTEAEPGIHIASDLPAPPDGRPLSSRVKIPGEVRLVFISRIDRMKNLKFALEMVLRLSGKVTFDIYGPSHDEECLRECSRLIAQAPDHITITYQGPVDYSAVPVLLSQYHFFLLPTLGENFGHVIFEALAAGCPVIISDLTPWRDLAKKGIGFDLPLDDRASWERTLQSCVAMENSPYNLLSARARDFAIQWSLNPELRLHTLELYEIAIRLGAATTPGPVLDNSMGRNESSGPFRTESK